MQNTKILEMLEKGQTEELKTLLREEIHSYSLKTGKQQRYAAMERYFSFRSYQNNPALKMPCPVEFEGEKYTSFCNGYTLVLTKEPCTGIELFKNPEKYINIRNMICFEGEQKELNITDVIAEAESLGYKLTRKEADPTRKDFKYVIRYDGAYFHPGLLDSAYGIINDGKSASVWHPGNKKKIASMIIRNEIGICVVLPFNYNNDRQNVTVIEAE